MRVAVMRVAVPRCLVRLCVVVRDGLIVDGRAGPGPNQFIDGSDGIRATRA